MEEGSNILNDALLELRTIFRWVLSGLIQAIFIVCWVVTQWGVNEFVIKVFALESTDGILLTIVQWGFAILTLAPILFYVIQSLVTMTIRTYRGIRQVVREGVDQ